MPVRQKPAFYASEKKRRWARDLFEHGYGYTKVASILELSENTVRDWQREYRKGRFRVQIADNQLRYSDELREKVLKMRAEGVSWRKISELTRVPVLLHDILKYPPNDINFDPPRGGVVRYFYNDEKVEDHGFRCSSQRRFQNHDYQRMPSSCAATCS